MSTEALEFHEMIKGYMVADIMLTGMVNMIGGECDC